MSEFYRSDCEKWAKKKAKSARFNGQAKLIKISPRGAWVIGGGLLVPGGKTEYPAWDYHWVVEFNGRWFDEAYPNGLPLTEFKARFEYAKELTFSVVT